MSRRPTLPEAARTLVQQQKRAMLASLTDDDGTPYGSLVDVSPLPNGDVLMLLSRLAEHRRFLVADARASLLVAPHLHTQDALARPRVTLLGRVQQQDVDEAARSAYLERHPEAALYLSLGDFDFFQLRVERVRYIAGFGRMDWFDVTAYRDAEPDRLWEIAAGAIEHMNDDHADSLLLYAQILAGETQATQAELRELDCYGMDIRCMSDTGEASTVRVAFTPPLTRPAELRPRLASMARELRGTPPAAE